MKTISFDKGYDLKTEDSEMPPVPLWMKYGLLIVAALLAFSIGYSGFRVIRHLLQKGDYDRMGIENIQLKNKIRTMEEQAIQVQALMGFFDTQQSWLKEKMPATELLIKVFEALPKEVSIQEAHIKKVGASATDWDLQIECCESQRTDIIEALKVNLKEAGILFEAKSDLSSLKIKAKLTHFKEVS